MKCLECGGELRMVDSDVLRCNTCLQISSLRARIERDSGRNAKSPQKALDTQIAGNHYKGLAIQPIEFIVKNNLDYIQGNVIKYIVRYKNKNGIEDLKKIKHYIDLLIEIEGEAK